MRARVHASWRSFRAPVRSQDTQWAVVSAFIAASVVLHVLMVGAVLWRESGRSIVVQVGQGMGANVAGSSEEAVTTMFFVEDSAATDETSLEELASAGKMLQSLRITIVSADSSLDSALRYAVPDERSTTNDEANLGEREARAALFGRYIGQIQARIERAWIRPRTNIGADLFECRVHVQQSTQGVVIEITLKECNGDARWQLSLVNAIQGASPLPSPPDPSVFANAIDLSFSSVAYTRDRTEQGYEPLTIAAFDNTTRFP